MPIEKNVDHSSPLVSVHNEWDPLEEIIVGTARYACMPKPDRSWQVLEGSVGITPGKYPQWVIDESEEDLDRFVALLESQGVVVRRPEPIEVTGSLRTPLWNADYHFNYCPRDNLLAVANTIIEAPSPFRCTYFDGIAYKRILIDYLRSGARWLSAPKPNLCDELYNSDDPTRLALRDLEPAFDAANILRAGRDLFYLVSNSGNELGWQWLQSTIGREYRVHPCRDLYPSIHIDSTLALLRPGLILVNPSRVNKQNLPEPFKKWDVVEAPEMVSVDTSGLPPLSSVWLGMNLLMINPGLAVVDQHQTKLIRRLEQYGIVVIPMQLRHARALAGGFHCITLDVRRSGNLEDYF